MNIKCEWCKKIFTSVSVLNRHKNNAKYCLKLQGILPDKKDKSKRKRTKCKWCNTLFTSMYILKTHKEKYHSKTQKIIKNLQITITNLKIKLENKKSYVNGMVDGIQIAPKRVISVKNTYINPKLLSIKTDNIRPLTTQTIKEDITSGKYTKEMFLRGVDGLVEFISNMITHENKDGTIERNYACTDSSRYRFHRLVESKEWKEDNGAHYVNTIIDEVKELSKEYFTEIVNAKRDAFVKEDEYKVEYYRDQINNTKLVYRGSQNSKGKYRNALFRGVRSNINSVAFV